MEEIKVGEYVRTKRGIIDRVIIDYYGICNSPNCNCKHVSCQYDYYDEEDITKHSKNIIDLIEVGDYVNGHEVLDIYFPKDLWDTIEIRINDRYINFITKDEIISIVTKEQFASIEYKI